MAPSAVPPFKTEDLKVAAALTASGVLLSDCRHKYGRRWECVFDTSEAYDAHKKFIAGELFVDAQKLFAQYEDLLDVVKGADK